MLKGKCVFITGASAGIGEACAREFSNNGCRLILAARRIERLEEISKQLETDECKIHCVKLDVRDPCAVVECIRGLPKDFEEIDILINNAGLALGNEHIEDCMFEDIDVMVDTNIKGLIYILKEVVAKMRIRGEGHIVNIGSIAGIHSYPGSGTYCATKSAVKAITDALRMELVQTDIRVSEIKPGSTKTEFSTVKYRGDVKKANEVYDHPGFVPLSAKDVAECVVFMTNRPSHVQINDLVICPTKQADSRLSVRNASKKN